MFLLIRRNLANRPARTLFTAMAIALGVSLIVAARLVSGAISDSAEAARRSRLAGADLEIAGATLARFDEHLAAEIAGRPGVAEAGAVLRVREGFFEADPASRPPFPIVGAAKQTGTGLQLVGIDPAISLIPYELTGGSYLSDRDADEILLPAGWAREGGYQAGSEIELAIGSQRGRYVVTGLIAADFQGAPGRPAALMPLGTLQRALGVPGRADAVLVRVQPDAEVDAVRDALQGHVGDQFFVTSATGGRQFRSLFTMTTLALPFASVVILLAGGFFVYNTFAITLTERRREIGQLRLLGMTRRGVARLALAEALAVATFGSLLGVALGLPLGRGVNAIVGQLQGDQSVSGPSLPLDGIAIGLAAGLLITAAVTYNLARSAGRVSPMEALQIGSPSGENKNRGNWLYTSIGLGFLLIAATGEFWSSAMLADSSQPSHTPMFIAALLFALGALALLPVWVKAAIRLAQLVSAYLARKAGGGMVRAGITGQIAVGSQARQLRRATITAATLTISLAIVISLSGIAMFFKEFLYVFDQEILSGDFTIIRLYQPDTSFEEMAILPALPPMPADFRADVEALSDMATISTYANVSLPGLGVESGLGDHYAFALEPEDLAGSALFPAFDGSWEEALRLFASGPAIMLPELTARRLDLHPGDAVTIETLQGPVPFTVALVGGGFPIITPRDAALYFGSHTFGIFFDVKPGADPAVVEERVQAIVDKYPLQAAMLNIEQLDELIDGLSGPIVGLFIGLASLSGLVAALGIVVTLVASVIERQRELGTLRSLGMTRKQLRSVILVEAGLLALVGASLGAVAGLGMSAVFGRMMIDTLEAIAGIRPVATTPMPWAVAMAGLVISPLIAMLAATYPAGRAARANPAEAMRAEGAAG